MVRALNCADGILSIVGLIRSCEQPGYKNTCVSFSASKRNCGNGTYERLFSITGIESETLHSLDLNETSAGIGYMRRQFQHIVDQFLRKKFLINLVRQDSQIFTRVIDWLPLIAIPCQTHSSDAFQHGCYS